MSRETARDLITGQDVNEMVRPAKLFQKAAPIDLVTSVRRAGTERKGENQFLREARPASNSPQFNMRHVSCFSRDGGSKLRVRCCPHGHAHDKRERHHHEGINNGIVS
jgi:hypothetical protein